MNLFNELDFEDDIELLDVYLEASTKSDIITNAGNSLKNMFGHMIKYQYNQKRQTKSWVATILRSYKELMCIDAKSLRKIINDDLLDKSYKNGRNEAIREDKENIIRKTSESRPYNWNIEFATNINLITDFLYTYYSHENIYSYDSDETIQRALE